MKQYDFEFRCRRRIEKELRQRRRGGESIKSIAKKAGVNPNTVSRLVYGETKYPRFSTIYGLLTALGVELAIVESLSNNILPISCHELKVDQQSYRAEARS